MVKKVLALTVVVLLMVPQLCAGQALSYEKRLEALSVRVDELKKRDKDGMATADLEKSKRWIEAAATKLQLKLHEQADELLIRAEARLAYCDALVFKHEADKRLEKLTDERKQLNAQLDLLYARLDEARALYDKLEKQGY